MAFAKFPREFLRFFSSLNLDYLRTDFANTKLNYPVCKTIVFCYYVKLL